MYKGESGPAGPEMEKQGEREEFNKRFKELLSKHHDLENMARVLEAEEFIYEKEREKDQIMKMNKQVFLSILC
ncbi:hypothetical protein KKC60_03835 [Patescibacteria group bacterium]|nr:hypothetical protein [Patescibacteria group bacterium]